MHRLWRRLASLASPLHGLSTEESRAVEAERAAHNRLRVLQIGCVSFAVHAVSLVVYGWFAGERANLYPRWHATLVAVHATMLVLDAAALLWARRWRGGRYAGELFFALYVGYGAVISANSQEWSPSIDVFLAVVLVLPLVLRLSFAAWIAGAAAGFAALLVGISAIEPESAGRFQAIRNGVPLMVVIGVVARGQLGLFTRDVVQRRQLEAQRDELRRLNAVLDRHLRERLIDRARELALAVTRLGPASAADELPPGTQLHGRFVVERLLGRGGMGTVYRCRDNLLDRAVALKVIAVAKDTEALQRFLREVEAMAELDHPAIARCLHVDVSEEGRLFQVHELVRGEALDSVQRRLGRLDAAHVARIGEVLAQALAAAHERGVVHRDVKPSNVILTAAAPGLRLLDFGVSKLRGVAGDDDTCSGAIVGTPAFMAPEQRELSKEAREPADVYALGATLGLLLTGERVHPGGRRLPDPLGAVVDACLAERPEARPTAGALRDRLRDAGGELCAPDLAELNRVHVISPEVSLATASAHV
jgi:serine/threonine-protein kinase